MPPRKEKGGSTFDQGGNVGLPKHLLKSVEYFGIIPRSIDYLLQRCKGFNDQSSAYVLRMNFIEIYNEQVSHIKKISLHLRIELFHFNE